MEFMFDSLPHFIHCTRTSYENSMPKGLSPEDLKATRQKIGAVATALYAAKGESAITIRDIAAKLGRSPMGLYRYFADRALRP